MKSNVPAMLALRKQARDLIVANGIPVEPGAKVLKRSPRSLVASRTVSTPRFRTRRRLLTATITTPA